MKLSIDINKFIQIALALETERVLRESIETPFSLNEVQIKFAEQPDPAIKLSILIPVWNPDPAQFTRCLTSLKKAELAGISHEIIISDNASESEIVSQCLKTADLPNVRLHRQDRNIGGFPNFNWCIAHAKGQWMHLMSHDDWIEPAFYQKLLAGKAEASESQLRYCRTIIYDEASQQSRLMFDEAPQEGILQSFMERQPACQRIQLVGAVFSRKAVEEVGGFDASLGPGADWEYWTRIGSRFPVYYHPSQLATYTIHQSSWSNREGNFENAEAFRKFRHILCKILKHLPPDQRRAAAWGFMSNMLQRLITVACRNKRSGRLEENRPVVEALMSASRDAGIQADIEAILASVQ
jgi:glycosyltransferase involved in cell wall biosynthesis